MAVDHKLYTVEEFEQIADSPENAHRLLELIDGEIVEKMPTQEHATIVANIVAALWIYNNVHKLGRVGTEVRHRALANDRNVRLPDASLHMSKAPFVRHGSVPEMPDLAVEVQSPDDTIKEMRDSARFYLANGSKTVWLVFPSKRIVEVYTPAEDLILTETDTITGGDLLPDFSLPVADVFRDPLEDASE
jgi:Uma2 family endonuclease